MLFQKLPITKSKGFCNFWPPKVLEKKFQQNQQLVNAALIKHTQDPNALFTLAELDDLNALALKCPLSDGTAVYQARALLCALSKQSIIFPDNCEADVESRKGKTVENLATWFYTLYPNPNHGEMTLKYGINQNATIYIYDVSGRLMYKHTLNKDTSVLHMQTKLAEGIYVYTIATENGTLLKTNKLVVIH